MDSAPSPASSADMIIVGAGPTGGVLALAAAQSGLNVILLDGRTEADRTRKDGRNFAIVRGSWALLKSVGLADALFDTAEPLNGLEAVDGGRHWFGAPEALFGVEDLDPREDGTPLGYMVEAEPLQAEIDKALAHLDNLDWRAGARFAGLDIQNGQATVSLEDGTVLSAQLVVGCDGVNSPVRKAAGIPTEGRTYGKSVFAANVTLSQPHYGIARQLFTPEGPFATLPLSGNRANLAWYLKTGASEAMAAMDKAAIEAELNARFAEFAGEMSLDGTPIAYPLILQIADAMVAPRIALVGDAARRVNPLAGQGLNLGFKDVAAFAEVLEDGARAGLDIGALNVLERYQGWRRFDANATALGLDMVDRLFSNDHALLKPLRGLGLLAANRIKPLRRALARQASADQASLPRRMRG
ncbi:MAG: FAD-dependent monooxygenase [Pseudomonadota bacterium]